MQTLSGNTLFPIGIGTWNIGSRRDPNGKYGSALPSPDNIDEGKAGIQYAIDQGINFIDTAEMYGAGRTEEVVGMALTRTATAREDLFIADKLWVTSVETNRVRQAVDMMLRRLQVDYIDLLYVHAPLSTWDRALGQMDKLIENQKIRYIGVSNFKLADLERAAKIANHPIASIQQAYSITHRQVTEEMKAYCSEHTVKIVAHKPLNEGETLQNPTVKEVARSNSITPAQVALSWLIQQDTLPIPMSTNLTHISENLNALSIELSEHDMASLDAVSYSQ